MDKQDRGEADQIFTIFTEQFGKIEVLGKAIRKITSKLRPGADVFYYSDIEFVQGKRHKTLTDVVVINKFIEINKNSDKTETANKISELIKNFASESEPDPLIWQLLLDVFLKLEIGNWKLSIVIFSGIFCLFWATAPSSTSVAFAIRPFCPRPYFFQPRRAELFAGVVLTTMALA